MKRPATPDEMDGRGESPPSDDRLKRALNAASMAPGGADVDALTARVLAQWQVGRSGDRRAAGLVRAGGVGGGFSSASASAPSSAAAGSAALSADPRRRRRRLWFGTAGLAATAVVLATAVIVNRSDPALDELMQPDVLSQLAIGEM